MIPQLARAFLQLFPSLRARAEGLGMVLGMALIPVAEIALIRLFTHLIQRGPAEYRSDPRKVVLEAVFFFVAYGVIRGLHHWLKVLRVSVFRRWFNGSKQRLPPNEESWAWARALDLSNVLVSAIQAFALSVYITVIDHVVGLANVVFAGLTLLAFSALYRRQFAKQVDYITTGSGRQVPIADRIGDRIRTAEIGAVISTVGLVASLSIVLYRTVEGAVHVADAVVLLLALRLVYGQLGTLSASVMRFARATARVGKGPDDDED